VGFAALSPAQALRDRRDQRRSPSAGDLRTDADPGPGGEFERAGATAVSILVDERFGGSLKATRAADQPQLPLIAKGFFEPRAPRGGAP
jgi:indole-3-glycerol phosphate synthase